MSLRLAFSIASLLCLGGPALSQAAPTTCTEAYSQCAKQAKATKQCEAEHKWCLRTGTFADPKTKAVHSRLQKK